MVSLQLYFLNFLFTIFVKSNYFLKPFLTNNLLKTLNDISFFTDIENNKEEQL